MCLGGWVDFIDGHRNTQQACILSVPLQWWKVVKYIYLSTVLKSSFRYFTFCVLLLCSSTILV